MRVGSFQTKFGDPDLRRCQDFSPTVSVATVATEMAALVAMPIVGTVE